MPGARTPIHALAQIDPAGAVAKIISVAEACGGNRPKMAKALKISQITLWRQIKKLDIAEQVTRIALVARASEVEPVTA